MALAAALAGCSVPQSPPPVLTQESLDRYEFECHRDVERAFPVSASQELAQQMETQLEPAVGHSVDVVTVQAGLAFAKSCQAPSISMSSSPISSHPPRGCFWEPTKTATRCWTTIASSLSFNLEEPFRPLTSIEWRKRPTVTPSAFCEIRVSARSRLPQPFLSRAAEVSRLILLFQTGSTIS